MPEPPIPPNAEQECTIIAPPPPLYLFVSYILKRQKCYFIPICPHLVPIHPYSGFLLAQVFKAFSVYKLVESFPIPPSVCRAKLI